jgi:hypothetical protein
MISSHTHVEYPLKDKLNQARCMCLQSSGTRLGSAQICFKPHFDVISRSIIDVDQEQKSGCIPTNHSCHWSNSYDPARVADSCQLAREKSDDDFKKTATQCT